MPLWSWMIAGMMMALVLSVAGCASIQEGMRNATQYDGVTPGTYPGQIGEPSGPLDNGIMPQPWGSTS